MTTAKIIRHHHVWQYTMNGNLKSIEERYDFKIVFSRPSDMRSFETWCTQNDGEYKYIKDENKQVGKLPELKIFKDYEEGLCWCDIMQYYLLHIAGYEFHSALSPYKGETYVKKEIETK